MKNKITRFLALLAAVAVSVVSLPFVAVATTGPIGSSTIDWGQCGYVANKAYRTAPLSGESHTPRYYKFNSITSQTTSTAVYKADRALAA